MIDTEHDCDCSCYDSGGRVFVKCELDIWNKPGDLKSLVITGDATDCPAVLEAADVQAWGG